MVSFVLVSAFQASVVKCIHGSCVYGVVWLQPPRPFVHMALAHPASAHCVKRKKCLIRYAPVMLYMNDGMVASSYCV
ncbi:hypothetical protein BDY21DRAFT_357766 [Lineolata rhizophorae]|uniref:Secreted protein n=1 Tax=Lineolata rhizophorae TaxID=578093 RepID=A0A6A6NNL4_9PEZI|nr:hypothetical protein BDY21DRAFT_357766 [Lineolata rhizophorae]